MKKNEYYTFLPTGETGMFLIEPRISWPDLPLNKATRTQLEALRNWITKRESGHTDRKTITRKIGKNTNSGYPALFCGPQGSGKTITASILGKEGKVDVYRIELSGVVSKFIGETEKNLSRVFEKAAENGAILFFDEADALFGKRTEVRDSHDRYANLEVSHLLSKIDSHPGMVILAVEAKSRIARAELRRFRSVIDFSG